MLLYNILFHIEESLRTMAIDREKYIVNNRGGEMSERFKEAVLKTVVR